MFRKQIAVSIVLLGLATLLLPQALPAHAQEPAPENDASCIACHEHEYFLYDRGKWFCLCDAPMHCVYCHGGRTDSPQKDIAHEGLVLYPTRNHAEHCQTCHTEDYMSRVVTFETVAGVSSTSLPIITATPITPAATLEKEPPSNPVLLHLSLLETWQLLGLGGSTAALVGIMIYGYRCRKTD